MKGLAILCMVLAGISLIIGTILRLFGGNLPFGGGNFPIQPQSILEFTIACLLFAIALSVFQAYKRS